MLMASPIEYKKFMGSLQSIVDRREMIDCAVMFDIVFKEFIGLLWLGEWIIFGAVLMLKIQFTEKVQIE